MAPKKSTADAPPSSRRSARIAEQPKSTANLDDGSKKEAESNKESTKKEVNSKKRVAEETNGDDTENKKTKAATSSKASAPKSGVKSTTSKKDTDEEAKSSAAKKEKEEEAPADAEPDTGSKGQLKKGDTLPKITLKDNAGADVDVSGLAGEKGVVIFLYPKADTPGCTTQACGFRDNYDVIQELGYDIYGLSKDKSEAQQKWINKKQLTYKLLCDPESKLIKRLGAFVQPNNTKRSHFIFEKGTGKLVDIALGVKPADNPKNVIKFLETHHKK
ncbi:uncharacterized protein L201_001030 [Kwoniella dendrophila CBS 6074]|uniref:thioredoxin-dependent peroxiredoxin n=1 Tax=Kwoniella dendrophila CBS 6074 TaxID=1295534 RepID=A0AAX4JMW4_9TREE